MSRKSRRPGKSSFSPLMKFFMLSVVVVAVSTFLALQQQGVLGISDKKGGDRINTTPTVTGGPTPTGVCKPPRVTRLIIDTPCDPNTRTGFRKAEFKCSDGTTGLVGKDGKSCFNLDEILTKAGKTCSKGSTCSKPSVTPRPPTVTHGPTPTSSAPTPTSSF